MALPIVPLLFLAGSAIAEIAKQRKAEKYQKALESNDKEALEKAHRQEWRNSLQRVVGGGTQFAPKMPTVAPKKPTTEIEDIIGALSGIGGQVSGSIYGRQSVNPY